MELMARRRAFGSPSQAQYSGSEESLTLLFELLTTHGPLMPEEVARDLTAQFLRSRRPTKNRIDFARLKDGHGHTHVLTSEVYARLTNRHAPRRKRIPAIAKREV
jgi:hypothetical protein